MDPYAHRVTYSPFSAIPSLKHLYLSAAHQSALTSIMDSIEQQRGCIVVTGEEGIGKTTLIRVCLQQLAQTAPQTTCVFEVGRPALSFLQILTRIAKTLGLNLRAHDASACLQQLYSLVLGRPRRGRVVLVIDDAHKLALETLQRTCELTMPTENHASPVQLVLLGLPSLNEKIVTLPRLTQQIALNVNLAPFTPQESRTYIRQQLAEGMLDETQLFTKRALRYIIRHARGVPKNLSVLCADTLNPTTYAHKRPLSVHTLKREFPDAGHPVSFLRRRLSLIGLAGLALGGLLLATGFHAKQQTAPHETPPGAVETVPFVPAADGMAPKPIAPDASKPQQPAEMSHERIPSDRESPEAEGPHLPEAPPASSALSEILLPCKLSGNC